MSKKANVRTHIDCARLCKANARCTHWTWVGPHYTGDTMVQLDCKLKEGTMDDREEFGLVSDTSECDPGKFKINSE